MSSEIRTLLDVLVGVDHESTRCWLYLPEDEEWSLGSRAAVLESDEVATEEEDDPDAGVPPFAKQNALMRALPIAEVQDIVANAKAQVPMATSQQLLEALLSYYDNDAYADLSAAG